MRRFLAIAVALLAVAVATSPAHAWQEVTDVRFIDRGRPQDLLLALDRQAEYLSRNPNAVAKVGPLRLTHAKLLEGVRALSKLVIESYEDPSFSDKVRAQFRVFRTSNPQKSGKAHFTAYYDPIINISLQRTPRFSEPIYRLPPEYVQGPSGCHRNLQQGRAPCHTRYEIEIGHALEGRGLEIAWTDDPVELLDARGDPVRVNARGLFSTEPDRIDGAGYRGELGWWTGPWPVDERWWEAAERRGRTARAQVLVSGVALLLCYRQRRWYLEGVYE